MQIDEVTRSWFGFLQMLDRALAFREFAARLATRSRRIWYYSGHMQNTPTGRPRNGRFSMGKQPEKGLNLGARPVTS